jgi:hypothetical protein
MSRFIAPGEWEPIKRQIAKTSSFVVGVLLIMWGVGIVRDLVAALQMGSDISMTAAALGLAPVILGSLAVFPNVVTPIAYRLIDKFMKDTPEASDGES